MAQKSLCWLLKAPFWIHLWLGEIPILLPGYPLVICYIAIENDHRNSGFSH